MMYTPVVICFLFGCLLQQTRSIAFLSVRFLTFRNQRGQDDRGRCCDEENSVCLSPCDHSFAVCLDQIDGPVTNISHCTYGKFVSAAIYDTNYINFKDRIGDIANPLVWRLNFWPGQVRLKIDVVDEDYPRDPDHVAYLQKTVSIQPLASPRGSQFKVGTKVQLTFEARAYCERDYYGQDCSVACKPQDDIGGHYSCDRGNGTKICLTGWTGKSCNTNQDDCARITCRNGGFCQDLLNMFECQCLTGFEGRFCEEDINECLSPDICLHGDCVNTPGSFTCTCFAGYTGETCRTDIDDCLDSPCHNGALCIDHVGDYECSCLAGFTGKICDTDINECQMDPCRNHGMCTNIVGAYRCDCLLGHSGNDCSLDINECNNNPCMNNGTCINHFGGYTCHCLLGFEGLHCETDVNECKVLNMTCQNHGSCVNKLGSFTCSCRKGYSGPECENDVDECLEKPCQHGGSCHNLAGDYLCRCPDGYTGKHCENNVNECSDDVCKNGGTCVDLIGSFECTCSHFWEGRLCEQNVNECLSNPCKYGGTCENIDKGFVCICPAEFRGNLCEEDVNECEFVRNCENNSTCINDVGTFICKCSEGWKGQRCDEDINECKSENCYNAGTCVNTEGGFHCDCPMNWTGQRCEVDMNECEMVANSCSNGATCHNVVGSFSCSCTEGWSGFLCNEDINECLQDPDLCQTLGISSNSSDFLNNSTDIHVMCMNTHPGYRCICDKGWTGLFCNEDIDECKENPLICSFGDNILENNATGPDSSAQSRRVCLNDYPGYKCVCAYGWIGQSCDMKINGYNTGSTSSSAFNLNYLTSATFTSGSSDTQTPDCVAPDCLVLNSAGRDITVQNSVTSIATSMVDTAADMSTSQFSEGINTTIDFSANYSGFSLPFNLDCRITPDEEWIVNEGLEQLFHDTHLFLGKELTISHRLQIRISRNSKVVTTIMPVIEVDGEILTDSEIIWVVNKTSHKFSHYLNCNLFLGDIRGNVSLASLPLDSGMPTWFPGFISACVLTVVLVASLTAITCRRKIKIRKKRVFKIRSVEVSRSFSDGIYQKKTEDRPQKSEDIPPLVKCPTKNYKSRTTSVVNMAGERSDVLTGRHLETENEDTTDACYRTPKQHPETQDSNPALKYVNIMNADNENGETCVAVECKRNQSSSPGDINLLNFPYLHMMRNQEFKVEVYKSNWSMHSQPMKQLSERRKMALDVEFDKYKGLPYIDDPGYTQISIKEEEDTPSNIQHLN